MFINQYYRTHHNDRNTSFVLPAHNLFLHTYVFNVLTFVLRTFYIYFLPFNGTKTVHVDNQLC